MTPKEKARELIIKFEEKIRISKYPTDPSYKLAKQLLSIAIDELIQNDKASDTDYVSGVGYWQQVKQEIEKL